MSAVSYSRHKTYDPLLRLVHAWNAGAILMLAATVWLSGLFEFGSARKSLWQFHIYLGYALIVGLAARLAWGMVGPTHARFSDLWHPTAWGNALLRRARPAHRLGHDALASAAYLVVYVLLLLMTGTGLALASIEHGMGPFAPWLTDMSWLKGTLKPPHKFAYDALMAFAVVHVGALVWHESRHQTPIAQSMVSGFQYRAIEENEDQQHA
ncbi:MAG: cytochrome b/b6 domain-containing protein [Betaproteobacteria bacterium]|nr:cytochrome b/b6 domain-containing protein [Betaproteobacteria bacterium]MDE2623365.1 cytochrome b/b6 domain-containing protein [Betaproteobacteria bacterium]